MIGMLIIAAQIAAAPTPALFQPVAHLERMDDANLCQAVRRLATSVSTDHPAQVDAATRLDRVTVVCAMREVSFNQAPAADGSEPDGASQDRVDRSICSSQVFERIVQRGWTLSTSITLPDGERAYRDVNCAAGSNGRTAIR